MYDTLSSEFELSKFYFTMLQVLRIASEWVQESMNDLGDFAAAFEKENMANCRMFELGSDESNDAAMKLNRQNWRTVVLHQRRLGEELLKRSAKKQEEIKSLRDELSPSRVA